MAVKVDYTVSYYSLVHIFCAIFHQNFSNYIEWHTCVNPEKFSDTVEEGVKPLDADRIANK